jgi:hypothetical protein
MRPGLSDSQMRQRRAPASGPRDCCARLAQAGVRNPCDQTPPFGHRQQRGGAPRFTRLRQAPPASSDNERGHRRRAGGDLRSPRSAAPSDPARNIPAGRAYANPRFCTPLCRPRFRRGARLGPSRTPASTAAYPTPPMLASRSAPRFCPPGRAIASAQHQAPEVAPGLWGPI